MADTGIFVTTAEVQRKTGAGASTVSNVEAYINQYVAEAESLINSESGQNWSDIYSTLNVDLRDLLKMAAGAKAAMLVVAYDMTGYAGGLREAETLLDVLRDEYAIAIAELKTKKVVDFIKET